MEHKPLKDVIREEMQTKGYSPERLGRETGIAERYVFAFLEGDEKRLPAAPYVRGYLLTIARVLNLNGNDLWSAYQAESEHLKTSGPADILPSNRFALRKVSRQWIIGITIIVILALYAGFNAQRFLGLPSITINEPSEETTVVNTESITIRGSIDPRDILFIGGESVSVDQAGNFEQSYPLEPGLNIIEFNVKKFLGRERRLERTVIYELLQELETES